MKKLIICMIALSCFVSTAFSQVSFTPFSKTLSKGGIEIEASSEIQNTVQTANSSGKTTALSDGSSHTKVDADLTGRYGVTDQLELVGGLRYRYIQTKFTRDFTVGQTGA